MFLPFTFRTKNKQVVNESTGKQELPFWKVIVQGVVSGIVRYLCTLLINQRTWNFLAVKIPEWIQRAVDALTS